MNNAILNDLAALVTPSLARSRYGSPEPQIAVRMPERNAHHRKLSAALHALAAQVELATPAGERWIVQTEMQADDHGRVYLELATDHAEEANRGLALLRKIAG